MYLSNKYIGMIPKYDMVLKSAEAKAYWPHREKDSMYLKLFL